MMKEPRDLFVHELKDMYDAEQQLAGALAKQAKEARDPEIRQAFREHAEETRNQIDRLKRVFKAVGKRPAEQTCAGMAGLLRERAMFKKEDPAPAILDKFSLEAAQKVERYEITAYEGLVEAARNLGLDDAIGPLEENLEEEKAMYQRVHSLSQEFDLEGALEEGPEPARKSAKGRASTSKSKTKTRATARRR